MKSWSQRELALAVLVVFAAPAIPYVTSRLLGDLSSLFLGTVPLIGTLLSLFLYACISALVRPPDLALGLGSGGLPGSIPSFVYRHKCH